ncbi:MAG: hypothetical protein KAH25_04875 [Bacteroidales bacterium]|nr:hypothetical protein [Bacteroidales bacterium]
MKKIKSSVSGVDSSAYKLGDTFKGFNAVEINAITDSFQGLHQRLKEAMQPGIDFQSSLAEVEAITGVTGDALVNIGNKARATAKEFGGDASATLDSYKVILSKLGPDIGKSDVDAKKLSVSEWAEFLGQATWLKKEEYRAMGAMHGAG